MKYVLLVALSLPLSAHAQLNGVDARIPMMGYQPQPSYRPMPAYQMQPMSNGATCTTRYIRAVNGQVLQAYTDCN